MKEAEIKKQAKKIMDDFAAALAKSGVKEETIFLEREKDRRGEKREACDNDFRDIMLDNAPETRDGFIVVERGGWGE